MAAHIGSNGATGGSQSPPDDDSIAREYDMLSSYTDTTDYYSLLALSRDPPPTDAAIRSAYRALMLSFHPDKQPSHMQEAARSHFGKIQLAYETLIDPKKRVVYDMLGEEGVNEEWSYRGLLGKAGEAERMEVGVKAMDEAQFRRWFVKKMKDKEHSVLEDLVQSKVHMQVDLDATDMFKKTADTTTVQIPNVRTSHAELGFRFKTPFPTIPGFKSSNNEDYEDGSGDGSDRKAAIDPEDEEEDMQLVVYASAGGDIHRMKRVITMVVEETNEERKVVEDMPLSLITGNFTLGASLGHRVQASGARIFNDEDNEVNMPREHSKFELGLNILPKEAAQIPRHSDDDDDDDDEQKVETARRMRGIAESAPLGTWVLSLHTSPANVYLSVDYGRSLFLSEPEKPALSQWSYEGYTPRKETVNSPPVQLSIAATVSIDLSLAWMISASRKFGKFTRMGLGVGVEGKKGLVCSITWSRLGQNLKFPIAICPLEVVDADIASLAVIVPWLTYSIMEFGYLRPRRRREQKKAIAKQQRRVQKLIEKRKADSLQVIELMREQVNRRQDGEEQRGGLVILHAEYGHIPPASSFRLGRADSRARENMVDVTIPIAALVYQGQLNIPSAVIKSNIIGFSDPAPFMPKTLRIEYVFGWRKHSVEIADGEAVTCPMRSHMV
ncbi:DnaJ domain-containing protein [Arthroderma uncinatum]|uniref:DnaJ domain-containing protein n=1 Tax=Arthroderma uncinatum TaxID=74035 RepID=UPI00144A7240|nr:DnaJ domain-containing protein [Arthroderma uncinatum]KAF3479548.1 DnaJ domain-containing protein [Arthroderma uncinatum]